MDVGEKEEFTLSVNTTGHILHAFVNDRLVGSIDSIARFSDILLYFEQKYFSNTSRLDQ